MGDYELVGNPESGATVEGFGRVDPAELLESLRDIRDSLAPIVQDASGGGLALSSVEVGLTLSATGKLAFIAEAGAEASITLTFERPETGAK